MKEATKAYKQTNDIFVRNKFLDELISNDKYFLVGEKGTGKTAYATYLSNNFYKNIKANIQYIKSTDYQQFINLKKNNKLDISSYTDIWEVILLLVVAKSIKEEDIKGLFKRSKLKPILDAINEYYQFAFDPEVGETMRAIESSEDTVKIIRDNLGETSFSNVSSSESNRKKFQVNISYLKRTFKELLSEIKTKNNIVIFVDGIDIRPNEILYDDYISCIRGLGAATWNLNSDVFSNFRDTTGRFRIVLLLRPDIYDKLNLQNAHAKLVDNSVRLVWNTTYDEYKTSDHM